MSYHHRYKPRDFAFAQRLLSLRKRTGLTQEAVALHVAGTEKAIRNWEGGSNYPSEANLRKLLELYLDQAAFAADQEQDEARALWQQWQESTHRRINSFDELRFATLLKQWQAQPPSDPHPASPPPPGDRRERLHGPRPPRPSPKLPELRPGLRSDI